MNRRPSKSRSGYDSFSKQHTAHFTATPPDAHFFDPPKKHTPAMRVLLFALFALAMVLMANAIANQFVHVTRVDVPITGLAENFEGFTLLHISDLKGTRFGSEQMLLRFALQNETFDVAVLTGDMVSQRGNAQPLYELIDVLRALNPDAPIYFIAGDSDPEPTSMSYASGGSPFAPWVLGAQQRGAQQLTSPQAITRSEQTLWLTTNALLSLDMDTMQGQFELRYLSALESNDEDELELSKYNLSWLEKTRTARAAMKESDAYITLTHVPPTAGELAAQRPDSLNALVDLVLCGHYMGGLLRLPVLGAVFIPSQNLPLYGLFPGKQTFFGLSREGRTQIYASPGLGQSDEHYPSFFFRLNNPPTVTLLSLTPSSL